MALNELKPAQDYITIDDMLATFRWQKTEAEDWHRKHAPGQTHICVFDALLATPADAKWILRAAHMLSPYQILLRKEGSGYGFGFRYGDHGYDEKTGTGHGEHVRNGYAEGSGYGCGYRYGNESEIQRLRAENQRPVEKHRPFLTKVFRYLTRQHTATI